MKPNRNRRPPAQKRASFYAADEVKIHGVNACLALFECRANDVIKVYLTRERMNAFAKLIKWCVDHRKAYKIAGEDELERLTESVHHEGVCVLAKEPPALTFETALKRIGTNAGPCHIAYLDGVANPHNVGNILRLYAHFGAEYVFVGSDFPSVLPPSARRVSEGGAEFVRVVRTPGASEAFKKLRNLGFQINGTSSHAAQNLFVAELKSRSVFVLGAETAGVGERTANLCDRNLLIPGTGRVESLNVASAAAIFAAEHARRFSSLISPRHE